MIPPNWSTITATGSDLVDWLAAELNTKLKRPSTYNVLVELAQKHDKNPNFLESNLRWMAKQMRSRYSLNSLTKYFNRVRDAMLTRYADPAQRKLISDILHPTQEEYVIRQRHSENKLRNQLMNIKDYGTNDIINIIEELRAEPLHKSKKEKHKDRFLTGKILLIMLITGRRAIDVLSVSNIFPVPGKPDHVMFDQVSKDKRGYVKNLVVPIHRLSFEELNKIWTWVRANIEQPPLILPPWTGGSKNVYLTSKYNAKLNQRIKRMSDGSLTAHKLRALSASLALKEKSSGKILPELFTQMYLGHVNGSSSTKNYLKTRVVDIAPDIIDDGPSCISEWRPELDALDDWDDLAEWDIIASLDDSDTVDDVDDTDEFDSADEFDEWDDLADIATGEFIL